MISAIIPTYRNPKYLDLCLKSAMENKVLDETEIIVVVDGFPEESADVISKYKGIQVLNLPENKGMQYALNVGVMNAKNKWVFIENDDNVFGPEWDKKFVEAIKAFNNPNYCIQINQVEPHLSIFDFVIKDFGTDVETFPYERWLEYEPTIRNPKLMDARGRLFPFLITKKWYMTVGGFDTFYNSPFWCDADFWLKLELTKQIEFVRWHGCHLYHFGSIATKNREDAEANIFKKSEGDAAQTFQYKWGYLPYLVEAAKLRNNSKLPLDKEIKGIRFN